MTLAERTYEFSEFLVDVLGITDLGRRFNGRIHLSFILPLAEGIGCGSPTAEPYWQR